MPFVAACAGMLYGLYRAIETGKLTTVAKSWGATSRTVDFAESPYWFALFVMLQAAFAVVLIVSTVAMARLFFKRYPKHHDG